MRPCPKWAWGEGSSPSSLAMGLGWTRAPSCGRTSPYLASPPLPVLPRWDPGWEWEVGSWEPDPTCCPPALHPSLCPSSPTIPYAQRVRLLPSFMAFSCVLVPVSVGRGRVSSSTVKWGFVIIWQRGLNGLRASVLSC